MKKAAISKNQLRTLFFLPFFILAGLFLLLSLTQEKVKGETSVPTTAQNNVQEQVSPHTTSTEQLTQSATPIATSPESIQLVAKSSVLYPLLFVIVVGSVTSVALHAYNSRSKSSPTQQEKTPSSGSTHRDSDPSSQFAIKDLVAQDSSDDDVGTPVPTESLVKAESSDLIVEVEKKATWTHVLGSTKDEHRHTCILPEIGTYQCWLDSEKKWLFQKKVDRSSETAAARTPSSRRSPTLADSGSVYTDIKLGFYDTETSSWTFSYLATEKEKKCLPPPPTIGYKLHTPPAGSTFHSLSCSGTFKPITLRHQSITPSSTKSEKRVRFASDSSKSKKAEHSKAEQNIASSSDDSIPSFPRGGSVPIGFKRMHEHGYQSSPEGSTRRKKLIKKRPKSTRASTSVARAATVSSPSCNGSIRSIPEYAVGRSGPVPPPPPSTPRDQEIHRTDGHSPGGGLYYGSPYVTPVPGARAWMRDGRTFPSYRAHSPSFHSCSFSCSHTLGSCPGASREPGMFPTHTPTPIARDGVLSPLAGGYTPAGITPHIDSLSIGSSLAGPPSPRHQEAFYGSPGIYEEPYSYYRLRTGDTPSEAFSDDRRGTRETLRERQKTPYVYEGGFTKKKGSFI